MDINQSGIFKSRIVHNFFDKNFGYSEGLYYSLNCSTYVGDDNDAVQRNLDKIRDFLQVDYLCSLKQVHGTKVLVIDNEFDFSKSRQVIEADAVITSMKRVGIGILTADCAPVLLHDEGNDIIGAIHCGWRSARFGIIKNTISEIKNIAKNPTKIVATIGPCIQQKSYEVKKDFMKNFLADDAKFFSKEIREEKGRENDIYRFDLPYYVKSQLLENGVSEVEILDIDTYESEDFFSYRRANQFSNGICGRQLSAIMQK